MRKMLFGLMSAGLLVASLAAAKPQPAAPSPAGPPPGKGRFMGAHPLMARPGAGYCYIDVPHVHDYVPDKPTLYQPVGDSYVFTGDPVPFGYEGNKTVFYGHHPVPLQADAGPPTPQPPTFCFMKGPHYHEYPVPEGPGFKVQNDVNFYIGPVPPEAARVRPQAEQALEVEYRPYVAQRPQVVVTPPAEWAGVVWVAPPPPVVVAAPAPAPVIVNAPPPVVVAAPQPQIVIGMPQPTVVIAPPQPVFIGPSGPGVIFMHGHGGNGHGHWGKGPGRGPGPGWGKGKGHWKHW